MEQKMLKYMKVNKVKVDQIHAGTQFTVNSTAHDYFENN